MRTVIAAAALASALAVMPADAGSLGILICTIDGGTGYVIGSNKTINCGFQPSHGGGVEHYTGIISKLGVDLGYTDQGALQWAVLAAGGHYVEGALAGNYYGVNAEATIATGGGLNLLVGGFRHSFTLQPLSGQSQTGLNLAVAVTSMKLERALK
jgi:Protein of unknown function (DUF992)